MQPAIQFADVGFAATPRYVTSPLCASATSRAKNSPLSAEFFCPGGAEIAGRHDRHQQAARRNLQARSPPRARLLLQDEAGKGCDIAQGIVEGQTFKRAQAGSKGGSMTLADLRTTSPTVRKPIEGTYRGYLIKAIGPPSSGALTAIQVLKLLERSRSATRAPGYGFGTTKTLNVMAEAMRAAFADRSIWMGDADFVPVPTKGLLAPDYIGHARRPDRARRAPCRRDHPPGDPRAYAGIKPSDACSRCRSRQTGPENGTTHFSVVDKEGNVVSYTNTIESSATASASSQATRAADGSFRNHGFLLNNELTDFNLAPSTNAVTASPAATTCSRTSARTIMTPTMVIPPEEERHRGVRLAAVFATDGLADHDVVVREVL